MGKKDKNTKEEEQLTRIAIVNAEKCKPSKCNQECKKSCPVVRMGALGRATRPQCASPPRASPALAAAALAARSLARLAPRLAPRAAR